MFPAVLAVYSPPHPCPSVLCTSAEGIFPERSHPTLSLGPLANPSSSLCSRSIFPRGRPEARLMWVQALRASHNQMPSAVGRPAPCPLLLPSGDSGFPAVLSLSFAAVDPCPIDPTIYTSPVSGPASHLCCHFHCSVPLLVLPSGLPVPQSMPSRR